MASIVNIPDYTFTSPTSISISGVSSSGKSFWTALVIKNKDVMFQDPPKRVMYCYGIWQNSFEELEKMGVEFVEGLPPANIGQDSSSSHLLLIVDDMMNEVMESHAVMKLFTAGSHHQNITLMYLNQNIYCPGKHARTIALNCHYLVLFQNPRDFQQISRLGGQLGMGSLLVEAYKDSILTPFGYLLVDISPHSTHPYRLRSKVLPGEDTVVYW